MRDVWDAARLEALDKNHSWHPFTQMQAWCDPSHDPVILVDGEGAILRDSRGREYIDGNSSIWTNLHGHRHPLITAAIKDQLDRVAHVSFLGSSNAPATELASRLVDLLPGGRLNRVFFSDDGSTAIEVAIKMAAQFWQLTGQPDRKGFIAFDNAYHGDTAGAASLGGISTFTRRFEGHHFPVTRITSPEDLENIPAFRNRRIAAVVIEPLVQGAAGIRLWPPGLLRDLRARCDETGTLLILDEVLTGFGRTGTMFACQQENVIPDFLCLAKGLTGGYMPLAATLTTESVFSAFLGRFDELKTFFYGHSYTANPLGCAAALANLDVFKTENVPADLAKKIPLLTSLLESLKTNPHVHEIRQCGFISGIEIRHPDGTPFPWTERTGARVCEAARRHGLLTRPILDTIVLMPPFCITAGQLESAVSAIAKALGETLRSPH
jgi:adenosylmethionine-8-amino-7-oxononanoate aminotransferase